MFRFLNGNCSKNIMRLLGTSCSCIYLDYQYSHSQECGHNLVAHVSEEGWMKGGSPFGFRYIRDKEPGYSFFYQQTSNERSVTYEEQRGGVF